jgi:hypothetical protein
VTVSQQMVAACDHTACSATVARDGSSSSDADLLSWLDSVGWVQFKAKQGTSVVGTFTFCSTHLVELRGFFGSSLDAAVGLTLVLAKIG